MRKKVVFMLCTILSILLVLFNTDAMHAAQNAYVLWRDNVLPALLPFFVFSTVLRNCGALTPANRAALFFTGFLAGAPGGAYAVAGLDLDKRLRAIAAAGINVVSPMFIAGAFCTGIVGVSALAIPILISQLCTSILVFICCMTYVKKHVPSHRLTAHDCPDKLSFGSVITGSGKAVLTVGAAIIVFMTVFSLLNQLLTVLGADVHNSIVWAMLAGMFEMTSGCSMLAAVGIPIRALSACSAFLFSFGGLCILLQSMTATDIAPGPYLLIKLIQGTLSALFAYLITPLFVSDAHAAFAVQSVSELAGNALSLVLITFSSVLGVSVIGVLNAVLKRKRATHNAPLR